jgi:hypothetical protein
MCGNPRVPDGKCCQKTVIARLCGWEESMTNAQARLLALPWVMVAGALYSMVREDFALFVGGLTFIGAAVFLVKELAQSLKSWKVSGYYITCFAGE